MGRLCNTYLINHDIRILSNSIKAMEKQQLYNFKEGKGMSEIKDTDDVDKPDEINSEDAQTREVDKELDDYYIEYIEKDKSNEFKFKTDISKNRETATERKVLDIIENKKAGIDYEIKSIGKQEVDVSKIDSPKIGHEDFKKHSYEEMKEYISQGGLEKDIEKPELFKLGDRYYVSNDGRHRVYVAKEIGLDKIIANVHELRNLK